MSLSDTRGFSPDEGESQVARCDAWCWEAGDVVDSPSWVAVNDGAYSRVVALDKGVSRARPGKRDLLLTVAALKSGLGPGAGTIAVKQSAENCVNEERAAVSKGKHTFQPKNRKRARKHGFRQRMHTRAGRAVIAARRRKGRARVSA